MYRYLMPVFFAAAALFAGSSLAATAQGVIHEVSGTVQATLPKGKPVTVTKGHQLANGTTITTGPKSTAIMRFADGTVVALEQNTSFTIQDYNYDEKQPSAMKAFFALTSGAMRALTGLIGQKNRDNIRVATPNMTIGIRGTDFMVAFNAATQTTSTGVTQGTIVVNNAAGTFTVTVGNATVTVAAGPIQLANLQTLISTGTFGNLSLANLAAIASAAGSAPLAAAGGLTGATAAAAAAAAAAIAAGLGGGSDTPASGTTGTTGTTGTR